MSVKHKTTIISVLITVFACISTNISYAANQKEQQAITAANQFIKVLAAYLTTNNYQKVSENYTLYNGLANIISNKSIREGAKLALQQENKDINEQAITEKIIETIKFQINNSGVYNKGLNSTEGNSSKKWHIEKWKRGGFAYNEENDIDDDTKPLQFIKRLAGDDGPRGTTLLMVGKYDAKQKKWKFNIESLLATIYLTHGLGIENYHADKYTEIWNELTDNDDKWQWLPIRIIDYKSKEMVRRRKENYDPNDPLNPANYGLANNMIRTWTPDESLEMPGSVPNSYFTYRKKYNL
ncbi:MAG: hypothetical protein Q4F00_13445 [bacterium]|nr:hypothetical protein [bacterium]